ncbi:unnamed protein product [Auanema sp. JU1783]|nr:unnamed protein product [Auanema sp. JU1783]
MLIAPKALQECANAVTNFLSPKVLNTAQCHDSSNSSMERSIAVQPEGIELGFDISVTEYLGLEDINMRLRRREPQKIDAIEAGFEPEPLVPRCHSTHSLSYNNSQFQPSELSGVDNRDGAREYATPLAVVGPRRVRCRAMGSSSEVNDMQDLRRSENRRTSLQMLNAAHLGYNGSSQFSVNQEMAHRPPLTPQSHRRSIQHVDRGNFNESFRIDSTVVTSTPVGKKVAVAPIPHKQRNHSYREDQGRQLHSTHDSSRHHVMYSNERLVDGPPSRVASLEQRVKELEAAVISNGTSVVIPVTPTLPSKHGHNRSSNAPSTQLIFSSPTPVTQQIMAKNIVEKEVEIERLQAQLRKAYDQMEIQQREYDEKLRRFKRDSDSSKEELRHVMNKLNCLDQEYIKYREQAALMADMPSEALDELNLKLNEQEKKMSKLREEKENIERQCSKLQRELEYLELQNSTLNKDLDCKEDSLKRMEQNLVTLQKEASMYHQSCSSGSTPLAEDTESLVDVRSPYYAQTKPYTKAHSTLGTNMSPLPTQKSNLRKSLSNFTIDATKKDDITPAMSQSLRCQQKKLADTRVLTKCLRDVLSECASGKAPDVRKFLGIRGDSMSESEAETIEFDSTPLSMASAERMIMKQEESIKKLEQDMEHMRFLIHEVYCSKVEEKGENPCAIQ